MRTLDHMCENLSKYVLNSCMCESTCSDCCEFSLSTEKVDIVSDSVSEYSVEVDNCLQFKHRG